MEEVTFSQMHSILRALYASVVNHHANNSHSSVPSVPLW
jgi:hypothetical protein